MEGDKNQDEKHGETVNKRSNKPLAFAWQKGTLDVIGQHVPRETYLDGLSYAVLQ